MQRERSIPFYLIVLIDLAIVAILVYLAPRLFEQFGAPQPSLSQTGDTSTVTARVVETVEAGVVDVNGVSRPYQIVVVEVEEGAWAGQRFTVDYGKTVLAAPGVMLAPDERIRIDITQTVDGTHQAYFADFIRTPAMLWLLGLFVVSSILLSGWKGVRSLLSMAFSFAVILGFILPRILAGDNPVLVSTIGAFVILAATLYVVYGWTLKTHAAALGTFLALSITGVLAYYSIGMSRMTGYGSEEALFLSQQLSIPLDLRGLLMSGILIGALGVLDDLVITQASAVFELHMASPRLAFMDLYRRSMRIGQDHVAATVNTLVLAYTGAALPLLLLVSNAGERFGTFINREFVAEEVVRTLVGSLGLIAAVPLTTGLACLLALHHGRLGRLAAYLGPISGSGGHDHHHHHH